MSPATLIPIRATLLTYHILVGVEVKYEEIFQGLRRTYDLFDMLDIEMVIAVPPGRSTIIHEKVRNAFVQGRIKSDAVSLASEPASMFCSWVHESTKTQDWKVRF